MPKTYNPKRVYEHPIPSTSAENVLDVEDESHNSNEQQQGEEENNTYEEAVTEQNGSSQDVLAPELEDVKPIFADLHVDEEDSNAFHSIFSMEDDSIDQESVGQMEPVDLNDTLSGDETASDTEDSMTKFTFDDGLECSFKSQSDFTPILVDDGYVVKPDDMLSNSWAFKVNVNAVFNRFCILQISIRFKQIILNFLKANGDRSYKIELEKGFKDIELPARAVNGLLKLNTEKRESSAVDKNFLKVLLIAICKIKRIRTLDFDSIFAEGEKDFIKSKTA